MKPSKSSHSNQSNVSSQKIPRQVSLKSFKTNEVEKKQVLVEEPLLVDNMESQSSELNYQNTEQGPTNDLSKRLLPRLVLSNISSSDRQTLVSNHHLGVMQHGATEAFDENMMSQQSVSLSSIQQENQEIFNSSQYPQRLRSSDREGRPPFHQQRSISHENNDPNAAINVIETLSMNEDIQFDLEQTQTKDFRSQKQSQKKKKSSKKAVNRRSEQSFRGSAGSNQRKIIRSSSKYSSKSGSKEQTPQFAGGYESSGLNKKRRRGSSQIAGFATNNSNQSVKRSNKDQFMQLSQICSTNIPHSSDRMISEMEQQLQSQQYDTNFSQCPNSLLQGQPSNLFSQRSMPSTLPNTSAVTQSRQDVTDNMSFQKMQMLTDLVKTIENAEASKIISSSSQKSLGSKRGLTARSNTSQQNLQQEIPTSDKPPTKKRARNASLAKNAPTLLSRREDSKKLSQQPNAGKPPAPSTLKKRASLGRLNLIDSKLKVRSQSTTNQKVRSVQHQSNKGQQVMFNSNTERQIVPESLKPNKQLSINRQNSHDEQTSFNLIHSESIDIIVPVQDVSEDNGFDKTHRANKLKQHAFAAWKHQYGLYVQKMQLGNMFYKSNLALFVLNNFKQNLAQTQEPMKEYTEESESEFEIPAQIFRTQSLLKRHFKNLLMYACKMIEAKSLICSILYRKQGALTKIYFDEFVDYKRESQVHQLWQLSTVKKCFANWRTQILQNREKGKKVRRVYGIYNHNMMTKVLASLLAHRDKKYKKKALLFEADMFYKRNRYTYLMKLSMLTFQRYSEQKRKFNYVRKYRDMTIISSAFKKLKNQVGTKAKKKESLNLVKIFYRCQMAQKCLKALHSHSKFTKAWRAQVLKSSHLLFLRKVFQKWCQGIYKSKQKEVFPMVHGSALIAANRWLHLSFGPMMQKVWNEFPQQKIKINPETKEPILIPNFLVLNRQKKYQQYFLRANNSLSQHYKKKVFYGIFIYAQNVRLMQKQRRMKKLETIFNAFRDALSRETRCQTILNYQSQKNTSKIVRIAFKALKINRERQQRIDHKIRVIERNREKRLLRKKLKFWHYLQRKLDLLRQNAKMSSVICRQRTLSNHLAVWMQKLHFTLKKKHMVREQQAFCTKNTKKKMLTFWRNHFSQLQRLGFKNMELDQKIKKRAKLNCLHVLKKYAKQSIRLKLMQGRADQERLYWIVKTAFKSFVNHSHYQKGKRELVAHIDADLQAKRTQKIFQTLRMYCQFKTERRIHDNFVTERIQKMQQTRMFTLWTDLFKKRMSVRLLQGSLKASMLRMSFKQIKRVRMYQDAIIHTLKANRSSKEYILQGVLRRWKSRVSKKNQERSKVAKFKFQASTSKLFYSWMNKSIQIQKNVRTVSNLILAHKYVMQSHAFGAIKQKLIAKRKKTQAQIMYPMKIKKKILFSLYSYYAHKKNLREKKQKIEQKQRNSVIEKTIFKWRKELQQKLRIQHNERLIILKRIKNFFAQGLKKYWTDKKKERQTYRDLTEILQLKRAKRALKKYNELTQQLSTDRMKAQAARKYHAKFLQARVMQTWGQFFRQQRPLLVCKRFIQNKLACNQKSRFLQVWMSKCEKKLTQIRAVQKVNRVLNKQSKRSYFTTWVSEANFLIDLNQKIKQFRLVENSKKKVQALQKLFKYSQNRIFESQKTNSIVDYCNHKLKLKVMTALVDFTDLMKTNDKLERRADNFYHQKLQIKALNSFKWHLQRQEHFRQNVRDLQDVQRQLYGHQIIQTWFNRYIECNHERVKEGKADDFMFKSLQQRAFKGLLWQAAYTSKRRFFSQQSAQHNYIRQACKVFKAFGQNVRSNTTQRSINFAQFRNPKFQLEDTMQSSIEQGTQTLQNLTLDSQQQYYRPQMSIYYNQKQGLERLSHLISFNLKQKALNQLVNCDTVHLIGKRVSKMHRKNTLLKYFKAGWQQAYRQPQTRPIANFASKLSKILNKNSQRNGQLGMQALFKHSEHSKTLEEHSKHIVRSRIANTKRNVVLKWLNLALRNTKLRRVNEIKSQQTLKLALEQWFKNAQEDARESDQIFRILNHFGQRRPESLLMFQKAFLISQAQERPQGVRLCSSSLLKYVFEHWRASLAKLRQSKQEHMICQTYNRHIKLNNFFCLWTIRFKEKRRMNCLQVYGKQLHDERLQSNVIKALRFNMNKQYKRKDQVSHYIVAKRQESVIHQMWAVWRQRFGQKCRYHNVIAALQQNKDQKLLWKCLTSWRESMSSFADQRSKVQAVQLKRQQVLKSQSFSVLKKFAQYKQTQVIQDEIVEKFRARVLLRRSIVSLKLNKALKQSKTAYSKLFAVFTAWKAHIRESKLLSKYLAESTANQSSVYHTISYCNGMSQNQEQHQSQQPTQEHSYFQKDSSSHFQTVEQPQMYQRIKNRYEPKCNNQYYFDETNEY